MRHDINYFRTLDQVTTEGALPIVTGLPICSISVVETASAFDALEEDWNNLIETADVSVFQTYEWQRTWWKYFGKGRHLHCVVFKRSGRTIGIAPMFRENITLAGIRVATSLQFIGAELSDYLQIITATGYENTVYRAFVQYLQDTSDSWDVFDIRDVSERFPLLRSLPQLLERSGLTVQAFVGNECPQAALPGTWEEFQSSLTSNMRHNLKRKTQRLEKNYRWEMEVFKYGHDDIPLAIEEFVKLHTGRWTSLGYPCAFDDGNYHLFHVEMAEKLAKRGWVRIFFLKINGTRVATSFDFNFQGRIHVYLSHAHASEEIMKLSPGFLLRCSAVQQGIAEGMKTYDFLRGNEEYKYNEFNCIKKENWSIRTASPTRSGQIHFKAFLAVEFLKRSRKRLMREYCDFKRFWIVQKPTSMKAMKYVGVRLREIATLGFSPYSRAGCPVRQNTMKRPK